MSATMQAQKRQRATEFPKAEAAASTYGVLDVQWESPFDRLCFMLSRPGLAQKNQRGYAKILEELISGSGCTEEEVLAHGEKVRAYLFFAEDRLAKEGKLATLSGREKYPIQLPRVTPAF